jgi:hypothetical protein
MFLFNCHLVHLGVGIGIAIGIEPASDPDPDCDPDGLRAMPALGRQGETLSTTGG